MVKSLCCSTKTVEKYHVRTGDGTPGAAFPTSILQKRPHVLDYSTLRGVFYERYHKNLLFSKNGWYTSRKSHDIMFEKTGSNRKG